MTQAPDPEVAELERLDRDIPVLATRAEQARQNWAAAEQILVTARKRRDQIAWAVHARAQAHQAFAPQPSAPQPVAPQAFAPQAFAPQASGAYTGEASTRTFQNILFILGGLLLGTAAIVFTAVAWASYGVGGRAAILGVTTALALTAPLIALWRGLRATAETFAGVGLLLVMLDGYAAWYVNLFGVDGLPGTRYAGLVCAVTGAVAAGYGGLTRLAGPGFVAILVAQPAVPLFAAEFDLTAAGWSMLMSAVVALNLCVVWRATSGSIGLAHRVIGWMLAGVWWLACGLAAMTALIVAATGAQAVLAGAATVLVALMFVPMALLVRQPVVHAIAAAGVVLSVVVAGTRFVGVVRPSYTLVLVAAVIAAVALAVRALRPLTPAAARPGASIGVAMAGGLLTAVLAALALSVAGDTVRHALPLWEASLTFEGQFDWQLLAALVLAAVAFLALLPVTAGDWKLPTATASLVVGVTATTLVALSVPGAIALPWWAPSVVDLAVATSLFLLAVVVASPRRTLVPILATLAAISLAGHAVLSSLGRPALTATVLGALVLIGLFTAAVSRRDLTSGDLTSGEVADVPAPLTVRHAIGGCALLIGLMGLVPAVGSALAAGPLLSWWVARLTLASIVALLGALFLIARRWKDLTWYAFVATLLSTMVWATVAAVNGGDPIGVYAGAAMVACAAALLPMRGDATVARTLAAVAAAPAILLFAVDVLPAAIAVVALPFGWFEAVWSGRPVGVGLAPSGYYGNQLQTDGSELVTMANAVALALLAAAAATTVYSVRRRLRAALAGLSVGGPTAVIVALVAARAVWPVVPAVTLLLGLFILTGVAIVHVGRLRTVVAGVQAAAYVGAGLSGALTVRWSTLVGLGSIVVAAVIVGLVGRDTNWRVAGWLVAVTAALATAATGGLAADLLTYQISFAVLAVAVIALAVGTALRPIAAAPWVGSVELPETGAIDDIDEIDELDETGEAREAREANEAREAFDGSKRGGREAGETHETGAGEADEAVETHETGAGEADEAIEAETSRTGETGEADEASEAVESDEAAENYETYGDADGIAARITGWRGERESTAVQGAAHAGAVVALLFTTGSVGYAAAISSMWGVAVGMRALWPGTSRQGRAALAAVAGAWQMLAWWLLLASRDVTLTEAYTLPLAGVALLAGWAALRARPDLRSWICYGPALAAASLPSLALVLAPESDDSPWRRLLLGAGAVLIVFAGAIRRRQAPVVVGGVVVGLVALHEIALAWDLIPRWIALGAGGLLLVALAITYERRRRDVAWLRATLGRMH